jgi:hypothetical protein
MPKRSRTVKAAKSAAKKRTSNSRRHEHDENQIAFDALQQIIKQTEGTGKNPLAVALGRLGGLKGGRARAEKLTGDERHLSAVKAATARWDAKRKATG